VGEEENKEHGGMPSGAELAAIPEASPKLSGARSKRCASESDVEVARQAEQIKALRNEGNLDPTSVSISFDNVPFVDNLENLGIVVGADASSTNQSLLELRKAFQAEACGSVTKDEKCEVLDLEEKVLADEE
jgi:hypothetical protein